MLQRDCSECSSCVQGRTTQVHRIVKKRFTRKGNTGFCRMFRSMLAKKEPTMSPKQPVSNVVLVFFDLCLCLAQIYSRNIQFWWVYFFHPFCIFRQLFYQAGGILWWTSSQLHKFDIMLDVWCESLDFPTTKLAKKSFVCWEFHSTCTMSLEIWHELDKLLPLFQRRWRTCKMFCVHHMFPSVLCIDNGASRNHHSTLECHWRWRSSGTLPAWDKVLLSSGWGCFYTQGTWMMR